MATAIVVGTVIGSGVFKKPHAIAKAVPDSGLVAGLLGEVAATLELREAVGIASAQLHSADVIQRVHERIRAADTVS